MRHWPPGNPDWVGVLGRDGSSLAGALGLLFPFARAGPGNVNTCFPSKQTPGGWEERGVIPGAHVWLPRNLNYVKRAHLKAPGAAKRSGSATLGRLGGLSKANPTVGYKGRSVLSPRPGPKGIGEQQVGDEPRSRWSNAQAGTSSYQVWAGMAFSSRPGDPGVGFKRKIRWETPRPVVARLATRWSSNISDKLNQNLWG